VNHLPDADWLFFYSPHGVKFLLQQISLENISRFKVAAMGSGTASTLQSYHVRVDFTGDGTPESTAKDFLLTAKGQRVLFCRAKESRQSIRRLLGSQITAIDLIVYENQPRSDFVLPDCDILVFTSPLNVQAYFTKKSWNDSKIIIAIGNTTAKALSLLGAGNVQIARRPSPEHLAEAVIAAGC
jgi:uroporphyrinogen-III synthase